MISYYYITLLLIISNLTYSTDNLNQKQDLYEVTKIDESLYNIYFDSIDTKKHVTKGTIVEYADYLAVIEVSIDDHKSASDSLKDHYTEGLKVINTLKNKFPNKPIKYIFSSHWHPHSLSSITPFLENGSIIITTKSNFNRLKELISNEDIRKYSDHIIFVEKDSLEFKDKSNSIIAYKADKKEFKSIPTDDYLLFYIPKNKCLQVGCMFQRFNNYNVSNKELISPRTEDLIEIIEKYNIHPKIITSLYIFHDNIKGVIDYSIISELSDKGILPSQLENNLLKLANGNMMLNSDHIIQENINNKLPKFIISNCINLLLEKNNLDKALEIAKIQVLQYPYDVNNWDTLGQIYYFMGNYTLSNKCIYDCNKMDPSYNSGGQKMWQKELERYQQIWQNNRK